jgi:hypothetical protein
MIKNNKEDCKWRNQGWTPCKEHAHSSICNKWTNGHYKTVIFEQDEIPPKGWGNDELSERIDEMLDNYYAPIKLPDNNRKALVQQINLLLTEVIDEVVGADDVLKKSGERNRLDTERNKLRAEIKQKAKDMLGEK